MKIQCPAKINLFLEVTAKRSDGYHNIATLIGKIHLYDVLDITAGPGNGIFFDSQSAGGIAQTPAGADNLVVKAADLFCRNFKVKQGISLHLSKRIPLGAGLGGGSSDAAGTLAGLSKIFLPPGEGGNRKILRSLARQLGADVPFFLQSHSFCLGRGIGDKLKPIDLVHPFPYLILVYPAIAVSTAQSYKSLAKTPRSDVLTRLSQLDKLVKILKKGGPVEKWGALLFNRLEQSHLPELKPVAEARNILERLGLKGVRMSGSGSSVFGFVASYEEGRRCVQRLSGYPWKIFLTSLSG